jgi:hypothetical protein
MARVKGYDGCASSDLVWPHLLADEDFNERITRGLRRRLPLVDILTAYDAGPYIPHERLALVWGFHQNAANDLANGVYMPPIESRASFPRANG